MDCDEYVAVWRYRERVREARAAVAQQARLGADRPPRPARGSLGGVFTGLGRWILGLAGTGAGELPGSDLSRASSRN